MNSQDGALWRRKIAVLFNTWYNMPKVCDEKIIVCHSLIPYSELYWQARANWFTDAVVCTEIKAEPVRRPEAVIKRSYVETTSRIAQYLKSQRLSNIVDNQIEVSLRSGPLPTRNILLHAFERLSFLHRLPNLRIKRSVSKFYLRHIRMHAGVDAGEHGKL